MYEVVKNEMNIQSWKNPYKQFPVHSDLVN